MIRSGACAPRPMVDVWICGRGVDDVSGAGGQAPIDAASILGALPDLLVLIDDEANLLWASDEAERWSGWTTAEMAGRPMHELVHPDDVATALASLASVAGKASGTLVEIRLRDRAGTYSRFEVRGRPSAAGVVLALRDVTDRRRWEVAAGDTRLIEAVLDAAPTVTMVLDRDGSVRGASRALTSILGRDLSSTLGRPLADLAARGSRTAVRGALARAVTASGSTTFEASFSSALTGTDVPMSVTVVNMIDDRAVEGLIVTAVDITPLAEARDWLVHLAGHDPLTGLANRALLFDRLSDALSLARRSGRRAAVVYGDLNGFKQVNDTFGHAAGDRVLVVVAERLLDVARCTDTVARIGGDEFVLVLDAASEAGASSLVARIREVMARPIELPGGEEVVVPLSCGWAVSGDGLTAPDELLAAADAAMYRVKRQVAV